jgi:uncharacterized protein (DUF4415 family)
MEFDWTPAKCAKNIAERGIDFADVYVGFADPGRKVVRDNRKDYGEARYNMLAKVNGRVFTSPSPNAARSPRSFPHARQTNGSNGVMAKAKVRAVLVDGQAYQKKSDGSLVPLKGKTDWKRLDRQTSAKVEEIADSDPEGAPMSDVEWARAEIVRPEKVAVGIKLDSDVLDWFKGQGKGYQTRINTVLRRFYEVQRKSGRSDRRQRDMGLDTLAPKKTGSPAKAVKRR